MDCTFSINIKKSLNRLIELRAATEVGSRPACKKARFYEPPPASPPVLCLQAKYNVGTLLLIPAAGEVEVMRVRSMNFPDGCPHRTELRTEL